VSSTEDNITYVDSLRLHQLISLYIINQLVNLFPNHIDDDGKLRMEIIPSTPLSLAVTRWTLLIASVFVLFFCIFVGLCYITCI